MPEGINNSLFLFFRCARRFTDLALGEIIVDTLCDTTFPLRLCNVQMCHMESVLLLHPLLDLLVCSPLLKPGHIHIFKRELHPNILTRYVSLGKLDNRLHMARGNETTKSYLRRFAGTCPLMAACSQKCVQEHINDLPVRQEHVNRFWTPTRYREHVKKLEVV